MNIKLAHKLDTPATLDCKSTKEMITFTPHYDNSTTTEGATATISSTSYTFRAECPKSGKNFVLPLKLWGAVDPARSTWDYGSVGRVSVRLEKLRVGNGSDGENNSQKGKKWPQLLSMDAKRPSNMHTWWKMQAKFDDEEEKLRKQKEEEQKKKEEEEKKRKEEADEQAKQNATNDNDDVNDEEEEDSDGDGGDPEPADGTATTDEPASSSDAKAEL